MENIVFTLKVGNVIKVAKPIYSDDLALVTERETSQIFYREKISGKLKFLREDYTWIMDKPFNSQYQITISISDGVNNKIWKGQFYRTDCTIDEVDRIISVEPQPLDKYNKILNALDNEIDLYEHQVVMNVNNVPGGIIVPPVIQFYTKGADTVQNYMQGKMWQTDVFEPIDDNDDLENIGFGLYTTTVAATQSGQYNLTYTPHYFDSDQYGGCDLIATDNIHSLRVVGLWNINSAEVFFYEITSGQATLIASGHGSLNGTIELSDGVGTVNLITIFTWARICMPFPAPLGTGEWKNIGNFATPSKWYICAQALGYNTFNTDVMMYGGKSSTPTKYGMINSTGYYYQAPTSSVKDVKPIFQSKWNDDFSFWFLVDKSSSTLLDTVWYSYNIPIIEIGNIIRCLLTANDINDVNFQNTSEYSQILYQNPAPITGWANNFVIWFTPKSNVVNGKSEQFATKAPIKLSTVFDFLRKALNVYWDINENGKLILEHWKYWKNGKSYLTAPSVEHDLTQMYNPRNGKPWAFGQNQYQFEKYTIPEKLTWAWMDDSDYFFDGSGITCINDFVSKGQTEETSISDITTNIDFLVTHPDECSKDGFAVVMAERHTTYHTRRGDSYVDDNTLTFKAQNVELAMFNLQKNALQYNVPCATIYRSRSQVTVPKANVIRNKTNEVKFPAFDVNPFMHVRTNVGDGEIETAENKICNIFFKCKLKYETE